MHWAALFRSAWSDSDGSALDSETEDVPEVPMSFLAGLCKGLSLITWNLGGELVNEELFPDTADPSHCLFNNQT